MFEAKIEIIINYPLLSTINYQLSTINYQLSTINYQLSTVNYQLSTVNYQLSTGSSTINCQLSTLVIGLGNPLLGDEGIGVALAQALSELYADEPAVECLDMGTGGMAILHVLAGHHKAIFLDCALMGEAPGTLRRFTPAEVRDRQSSPRCSLHEGNLLELLTLAGELQTLPPEIVIFGIEPHTLAPGCSLSLPLQHLFPDYLAAIRAEIESA